MSLHYSSMTSFLYSSVTSTPLQQRDFIPYSSVTSLLLQHHDFSDLQQRNVTTLQQRERDIAPLQQSDVTTAAYFNELREVKQRLDAVESALQLLQQQQLQTSTEAEMGAGRRALREIFSDRRLLQAKASLFVSGKQLTPAVCRRIMLDLETETTPHSYNKAQ